MFNQGRWAHKLSIMMDNAKQNLCQQSQLDLLSLALLDLEMDLRFCESPVEFELLMLVLQHIRESISSLT